MNTPPRFRPLLESLETRDLLSHSPVTALPLGVFGTASMTPSLTRHAYDFDRLFRSSHYNREAGKGQTVAVVDAYTDRGLTSELRQFSSTFHLGRTQLRGVYPGGVHADPIGDWNFEIALDAEWVHAIAPAAKILYVGARDSSGPAMLAAVKYAEAHANVVTLSWGTSAFKGDSFLDSYFKAPRGKHVATFAAAGDSGPAHLLWPAHARPVISTGGTTLNISATGRYLSERFWPLSGPHGAVGYDSDPLTGFLTNVDGIWYQIGGTSAASPQWAALTAVANSLRARHHLPEVSSDEFKAWLKGAPASVFHHGHGIPGRGSPIANRLVPNLSRAKVIEPREQFVTTLPIPSNLNVQPQVVISGHRPARLKKPTHRPITIQVVPLTSRTAAER